MLEELVESDPTFDYDAWLVRIDGQQVRGRWGVWVGRCAKGLNKNARLLE